MGMDRNEQGENDKMIGQLAKAKRHGISCWIASEVV